MADKSSFAPEEWKLLLRSAIDAAVLYQQHAKATGIDLNVIREPDDGFGTMSG